MAALPPVSKVVRVDHHFAQSAAANIQIRTFLAYTGALSSTDAATWLANIVAGLHTNVVNLMSNTISTTSHELTDLTSTSAAQVLNSTSATGGQVAVPLASGTAMIMKHKIARRYRGGHPRTYIPGIPQADLLNPTQWGSVALGNMVAGYTAYIAAATANTNPAAIGVITHVNVSYFAGFTNKTNSSGRTHPVPTPRVTPVVDTIINTSGNPVPGSQRRRD